MESVPASGPVKPRARRGRPPERGLAERRRRQLVESACVVFAEHGYEAASMSDVAKHAGVGQGTVYRYFESKRALLDHVLDHCVEHMLTAVRTGATKERPGSLAEFAMQVRAIADRLFELLENEPELIKLVLVEASAIDEELKARLLGLERTLGLMMASYLDYGVEDGWLRHDLDTQRVAHAMNTLVIPGFLLALRGDLVPEHRTRYAESLVSFAIYGMRGAR